MAFYNILDVSALLKQAWLGDKDPDAIYDADKDSYHNTAEYGAARFLARFSGELFSKEVFDPRHTIAVFDSGIDYRRNLFSGYKAKREQKKADESQVARGEWVKLRNWAVDFFKAAGFMVNPNAYRNKTAFIRQHVQYDLQAQFPVVLNYLRLDLLRKNLYQYARRVEKRNVTPLAVPTVQVHPVKLAGPHRTLYKTYLRDRYAVIDDTVLSAESDQKLIQDAHQLVSVPEKFDPKGAEGKIAKANELRKTLDTLLESIDLSQRKVLVFAKYTSTVAALAKHYKDYNPAVLNGKTANGDAEVEKFQTDDSCRLFVLNWTSGGAGLNLQSNCSTVIFYETPTSPKDAEQAMGRVDRTGQKEQVNLHFFDVKGTYAGRSLRNLVDNGLTNNKVIGDINPLIYEQIKEAL